MHPKHRLLYITATLLFLFALHPCVVFGQSNGSFYLSAGYNEGWYGKSTIHIDQPDLNNSYDIQKAPGNNKTHTAIGPLHLNYRIGYYFDHYQVNGLELNFDPVNYQVTPGKTVHVNGTVNNLLGWNKSFAFTAKNGFYYKFEGADLLLLNYVRRFEVYRPTSKKIGVDVLGKIGGGPALPVFNNSLSGDAAAGKQFQYGGWNAAAEVALRGTFYRYLYVEIAAKYDHAQLNALPVYEGTARQNLNNYEAIGSIGFTFPVTRRNPLFYVEHEIVTILPLFLRKDSTDLATSEAARKNRHKKGEGDAADSLNGKDIPEFQSVLDKKRKRLERLRADSLANAVGMHSEDSLMNAIPTDLMGRDSLIRDSLVKDSLLKANPGGGQKKRKWWQKKKKETQVVSDSTQAPATAIPPAPADTAQKAAPAVPDDTKPNVDSMLNSSIPAAPPSDTPPQATPKAATTDTTATAPKLSKKDKKKLEKEKKRLEKEAEKKKKEEDKKKAEELKQAAEEPKIPDTPPVTDTTKKDGQ